jgi:hypothetical protein
MFSGDQPGSWQSWHWPLLRLSECMEQTTMLKKMHWQNGTWNNHNPGSFKKISVWKILDYLLGGITIQSYANFECFG